MNLRVIFVHWPGESLYCFNFNICAIEASANISIFN